MASSGPSHDQQTGAIRLPCGSAIRCDVLPRSNARRRQYFFLEFRSDRDSERASRMQKQASASFVLESNSPAEAPLEANFAGGFNTGARSNACRVKRRGPPRE